MKNFLADLPIVKFVNGLEIALKTERFTLGIPGGGLAARHQLPLKLAWAISIHKSQVTIIRLTWKLFIFYLLLPTFRR